MGKNKQDLIAYWSEWAEIIISAYDMQKHGKEYKGTCPVCGGYDRFHIKDIDGVIRLHCRKGCTFKEITNQLQKLQCWPTVASSPKLEIDNTVKFEVVKKEGLYHDRKGVPLMGAKIIDDKVKIEIYKNNKIVGYQTITPDGEKRFNKQLDKEGAYGVINAPMTDTCYIGEGWATCASVAHSTNKCVIWALDSGNLPKVARAMQQLFPDTHFVVAADNDPPGLKCAEETGLQYKAPKTPGMDWNDVHLMEGEQSVKKQLSSIKKPKPLFVQIGELEFRRPQWIIEGLLEQHSFAVCFGAPAAGKTFVTLDMALCVASGSDFHNHKVKKGAVFYIAGEGHNGFARRAAAWSKERNITLKGLPFFKSNNAVVLTEEDAVERLLSTIDTMVDKFGSPELIVFDTLNRSMGGDENSTKDMSMFIQAIDRVKNEYECTVLAVHHTGHSQNAKDRARGSSALLGAVDAEFKVEKWGGDKVEVSFTKMKDALTPEPMNFIHKNIDLIDADMNEAQSLVLEQTSEIRNDSSEDGFVGEIIKQEMEKIMQRTGQDWVSRSEVKREAAIATKKSPRQIDRTIKDMIDNGIIPYENNKLQISWTS